MRPMVVHLFLSMVFLFATLVVGGEPVSGDPALLEKHVLEGKWTELAKMEPDDALSCFLAGAASAMTEDWDGVRRKEKRIPQYKNYSVVVSRFVTKLSQQHPDNANAQYLLGAFYEFEKDFDKAISSYEAALKLNPSFAHVHYSLGYIHGNVKGDRRKQVSYAGEAIKCNPDFASAYLSMGRAHEELQEYDGAFKAYQDGLTILEKRKVTKGYLLGQLCFGVGWIYLNGPTADNDKAILFLKRSVEADPTVFEPLNELGIAYKRKAMYDEAVVCYQKAVEIKKDAAAYFNLGVVLYKKGLSQKAKDAFEQAIKLEPESKAGQLAKKWLAQIN